jgi:hypothetical protein
MKRVKSQESRVKHEKESKVKSQESQNEKDSKVKSPELESRDRVGGLN